MPTDGVAAALAVARAGGLDPREPVVLRDAWHVLVHLRPFPVVARVSTTIPFPEGPHPDDLVRELEVAAHAARAGAAVIPPADEVDPGPHRYGERIVTFWRYIEENGDLDPGAAGTTLRAIHEALADYAGPLPPAGHPADLDAMLARLEPSPYVDVLREVAARAPRHEGQALHGDAHLWNCLPTASGPLWHDFECACRGPREYDLAALVLRDRSQGGYPPARAALAAYGDHDRDLLEALVPVYAAWVYASMLIALPRRPDLADLPWDERMSWLASTARGTA
ncbi:MAG TPA: phosphotransferase [Gaiellaceae bacterium]|nr:phosphotransferase [Gaiellaceae bacterium]